MNFLPGPSRALPLLLAGALLAGCAAPPPPGASGSALGPQGDVALAASGEEPFPGLQAPVVVALPDSGINPYHEAFRAPIHVHPSRWLQGFPEDAQALPLTLDAASYDEALAADRDVWTQVEPGKLYWIPGTRIVGAISFGELTEVEAPRPLLDDFLHGTAVAGAVVDAAPGALLVAVETYPLLGEALTWVVEQDWIDVVSISIGTIANLPVGIIPEPFLESQTRGSRLVTERGMLVVAAAGNTPTLTTSDSNGPPWVISVGGARSDQRGEVLVASKGVDVVSDYLQETVAHNSTDQRVWRSGTSFAAPRVAGTLAHALALLRADAGQHAGRAGGPLVQGHGAGALAAGLTNADLRELLNRTAAYWPPQDWSPQAPAAAPTETLRFLGEALSASVPVGPAPWVQMGWGYVGPDLASALAEAARGGALAEKPEAARAHMAVVQAARCALWCDS